MLVLASGIAAGVALSAPALAADSNVLLYNTEGNRLHRYDVDTIGTERLVDEVLVERASAGEFASPNGPGRDINGQICEFPDGSGRFIAGEDTGQPNPSPGWGIFEADGTQSGKLTSTYQISSAEPHGCAFDPDTGVLYTSEVGEQGFLTNSGQLIMWFPPLGGFPGAPGQYPVGNPISTNFCKLAVNIGTAASVLVDPQGRVVISASGALKVERFNPPFPTSPNALGGCGALDPKGSPLVDASITVRAPGATPYRETSLLESGHNLLTPAGLALSPAGTLYVSSVLDGRINEYDLDTGAFIRQLIEFDNSPFTLPTPYGSPQGIAVGPDGTIYYADLDLRGSLSNPSTIGPGNDGKVWRVRFDENGDPLEPEQIRDGLAFPDGVAVFAGNLQQKEWPTFAGAADRRFYNADEKILKATNIDELVERWSVPTSKVITGSPTVATIDVPEEGLTRVVYFQSWNLDLYAVRASDGVVLWRVSTIDQPGATFPATASIHVAKVDNRDRVFVGQGENLYSFDAATGNEIWRFTAGTGCGEYGGTPPGLCGFDGERNEIESSAYVADGKVFFGMDVNDVDTGKGGFYAVDAAEGHLVWFFDVESGITCHADPGDDIRRYDGYHSAAELGLPADFLTTRAGCNHPRTANGCGNVWSSPAVDLEREALFFGTSNCDTEIDSGSGLPEEMPPFDEAILSLDFRGVVRFAWRPREFDNADLAFGGVPNLFSIDVDIAGVPTRVDVIGLGNKDGTYYVVDRDGVNQQNGTAWDDDAATHLPADLPYWSTNVVDGGDIGGMLATASVNVAQRRLHVSTAAGESSLGQTPPFDSQIPSVHALDLDTGAILWDNFSETPKLGSFSSMLGIPGIVFAGTSFGAKVRSYFAPTGTKLAEYDLSNFGLGSTPVVIDGTLYVGSGIGTRTSTGSGLPDLAANSPANLVALCVPGTLGCAACDDGLDNDFDGSFDTADTGCVGPGDDSEVKGDLDGDSDVDERDLDRFFLAFGRERGDVGYSLAADLDPPGAPDDIVGLVDYQRWLAAEEEFNAPPPAPACGLVGIEVLLAVIFSRAPRRARARRGAPSLFAAVALALLAMAVHGPEAQALSSAYFVLPPSAVIEDGVLRLDVGDTLEIEVRADFDQAIVGFGFDIDGDETRLEFESADIGPDWTAVFTPDGDGLGGLEFGPGLAGNGILLATVSYFATHTGPLSLSLSVDPDDPTEGFALRAIGLFENVGFGAPIHAFITPEPGSGLLAATALFGLAYGRRKRWL